MRYTHISRSIAPVGVLAALVVLTPQHAHAITIEFNDVYFLDQSDPPLPVSTCSYMFPPSTENECYEFVFVASGKEWLDDDIAAGPIGDEYWTLNNNLGGPPPPSLPVSIGSPAAQYQCSYGSSAGVWAYWNPLVIPDDEQPEAFAFHHRRESGMSFKSDVATPPGIIYVTLRRNGLPWEDRSIETPHPVYGMAILGDYGSRTHFLASMPAEIYHYAFDWDVETFEIIAIHPIGGALGGDFTSMEFLQTGDPGVGYLYATNAQGVGRAEIDLSAYLPYLDCNQNLLEDILDIQWEFDSDCNGNSIPDGCDIADGAPDVNANGLPDECEVCTPAIINSIDLATFFEDGAVSGNLAAIINVNELQILDISNPLHPTVLGTTQTMLYSQGVAINDSLVLVASSNEVLEIFDISDPTSPASIGSVATSNNPQHIATQGEHAYLATWDGLEIVDISDPVNPVTISMVPLPNVSDHVYLSGPFAYVANSVNGVQVIDISDPVNPAIVHTIDTLGAALASVIRNDLAYIAGSAGLEVIDITDLANPVSLGLVDHLSGFDSLRIEGDRAYIGNGDGLVIIDISDPTNPTFLGSVNTPGSRAFCMAVFDNVVYMPDRSGLHIVDVADCQPLPCPWDVATANGVNSPDGHVGVNDFFALLQNWGTCPDPSDCRWDFDGSGDVDVNDFFALLQHWGPCE